MPLLFTVITKLIFISFFLLPQEKSLQGYEDELNKLVLEFKKGCSNDEEFKDLVIRFEQVKNEIEEFGDEEETLASKILLEKSEALTALVGELSPIDRVFNLSIKKYELAASILELNPYDHPHLKEKTYCLPISQFYLWDDKYQALLVVNKSSTLKRFIATTLKTKEVVGGLIMESDNKSGVDCYSMRSVDGFFTTKEGIIQCINLECRTTPYCITKK